MSMRITGKLCTLAVVAAALTVGTAGFAHAQGGGGGGGGGGRRQGGFGGRGGGAATLASIPAAVLADGLKLSASQTSKVQAIQDQYRKDRTALFSDQGADRNEQMQKMGALQEDTVKSIQGVLNESQNKAAPAFVKSVGGYRMVGIPLEVLPDLKLTSDQKTKITAIAEGAQKEMADARAAAQANGGGAGGGGGGGFQAMQEMMKANSDKVSAILTATQKATLAKYNADHPQRGFGGGGGRRGGGNNGGAGGNGPV